MRFGVHGTEGPKVLIGRCFNGPIALGDMFDRLTGPDGSEVPVRLRVVGIWAYGHDFDVLDEGMSARLTLDSDVPTLADRDELSG